MSPRIADPPPLHRKGGAEYPSEVKEGEELSKDLEAGTVGKERNGWKG